MFGWIKEHPYLSGGLALMLIVVYIVIRNLSSSSQASNSPVTAAQASGVPDDTIAALQLQTNAQIQSATLSTDATIAGYNAAVNQTQIQASSALNLGNDQTQAALTLGLAQNGNNTQSILELLGGQPGASSVTSALVNPSLFAAASNPPNAVTNTDPIAAPPAAPPVSQQPAAPPAATNPVNTGASNVASVPIIESNGGATDLYDSDVSGANLINDSSYAVNPAYYATGAATSQFASILGLQAGSQASVVGASGGPFVNPAENTLTVPGAGGQPAGPVDAGQLINELQSTAPGEWSTILGGYGVGLSAAQENQIYQLFGANQAVPEMSAETSNVGG
jgi:hypothetical protein